MSWFLGSRCDMKINRWCCVSPWEDSSVMPGFLWPYDCGAPVPSVHVILQARIVECVAMPSSGDLPDPEDLPDPGHLPTQGPNPRLFRLLHWQVFVCFFTTSATQGAQTGGTVELFWRKDWCWSWSEVAQSCPTLCDPWTVTYQAPFMDFSRQEY